MRLGGNLVDIFSLEFQVLEKITNPAVPIQTFPPSGRQTVAIGLDCPVGDRLGVGHYVARYTVPTAAPTGTYELRWFYKLTPSTPEQEFREEFEVLPFAVASGGGAYTTIACMRQEGVPETGTGAVADGALLKKIIDASSYVDKITGRWFEPRTRTYTLDGSGTVSMLLQHPIIALGTVAIEGVAFATSDIIVYNRHISQGLDDPDDRENPKFELNQPLEDDLLFKIGLKHFPRGQLNMSIDGVFGYTDYDGTSTGITPPLIEQAVKRLVVRQLGLLASGDGTTDLAMSGHKITELRTRDQWIRYGDPNRLGLAAPGPFTGDREIDNILLMYRRPPRIRAV
jgi:hypothetical protein